MQGARPGSRSSQDARHDLAAVDLLVRRHRGRPAVVVHGIERVGGAVGEGRPAGVDLVAPDRGERRLPSNEYGMYTVYSNVRRESADKADYIWKEHLH